MCTYFIYIIPEKNIISEKHFCFKRLGLIYFEQHEYKCKIELIKNKVIMSTFCTYLFTIHKGWLKIKMKAKCYM
jgi:hypothetical protein